MVRIHRRTATTQPTRTVIITSHPLAEVNRSSAVTAMSPWACTFAQSSSSSQSSRGRRVLLPAHTDIFNNLICTEPALLAMNSKSIRSRNSYSHARHPHTFTHSDLVRASINMRTVNTPLLKYTALASFVGKSAQNWAPVYSLKSPPPETVLEELKNEKR